MPDLNFFKIARRKSWSMLGSAEVTRFGVFRLRGMGELGFELVVYSAALFAVDFIFLLQVFETGLSIVVCRDDDTVIGRDYDQSAGCSHHFGIDSFDLVPVSQEVHDAPLAVEEFTKVHRAFYHLSRNRSLVHSIIDVMGKCYGH